MANLWYMATAYAILWAVILVYFFSLSKRERSIWEELQALKSTISQGDSPNKQE